MNDRPFIGEFGEIFSNSTILWFIILFLLLFWGWGGFRAGFVDSKE